MLHAQSNGVADLWLLQDLVTYTHKSRKESGILFGITRNKRSHRVSMWISSSAPEKHIKVPLEHLISRVGVATQEDFRAALQAAGAPPLVPPIAPIAPPPRRVAAVKASAKFRPPKQQQHVPPLSLPYLLTNASF